MTDTERLEKFKAIYKAKEKSNRKIAEDYLKIGNEEKAIHYTNIADSMLHVWECLDSEKFLLDMYHIWCEGEQK